LPGCIIFSDTFIEIAENALLVYNQLTKSENRIPLDAAQFLVSLLSELDLHPDHSFEARIEVRDT